MHPNQFAVNEAWLVFKLNDEPIHTERDGAFNFLALMDAASCFILSSTPVSASQVEPTQLESRRLLKEGQSHKKRWPKTLFVPTDLAAQFLSAEAEQLGVRVVRVPEDQLSAFITEARQGFREHFGNHPVN
jgi:hypothetical protein